MGNSGNSSKKWECAEGCDQKWFLQFRGKACPHLEALIPRENAGTSIRPIYVEKLESLRPKETPVYGGDLYTDEVVLRRKLLDLHIKKQHIEIVIKRVVYNKTFEEIAEEMNLTYRGSVHKIFGKVLGILKKKGFK